MDYYQQGRPQVSAPPASQHYVNYSTSTPATNSAHMYYQQQQMQAQQQTYQQHYSLPPGPTNSGLDFTSPHSQSLSSHNQTGNGRIRSGRLGNVNAESSQHQVQQRYSNVSTAQEFPLRIIVDSKYVGAIIGTSGTNIREITKETKARVVVDVQRTVKDSQGHSEKVITIIGSQENASRACMKILEVVLREQEKEENRETTDVELKIRAHNQLVGRLIGRQGSTIKKIMQETGTTIFVSNSNESTRVADMSLLPHFPEMVVQIERTITVRGPTLDTVAAAEQKISGKLRQSFEMDIQNRIQMTSMQGGMQFLGPMNDPFNLLMPRLAHSSNQTTKSIKLYVPNNMVGAIIGAKGVNIRNIIRQSGANIRIDGGEKKERPEEEAKEEQPIVDEGGHGDGPRPDDQRHEDKKEDERLVTIVGNDLQLSRAMFLIYSRIADQMQTYLEEVKLRTEVIVPSRLVGRIIGKGGQNVRELQRITGASVKIPEDEPKVETSDDGKEGLCEGTIVRIVGNLHASMSVQARIGQLINDFSRTSLQDKKRDDHDHLSHKQQGSPTSNGAD